MMVKEMLKKFNNLLLLLLISCGSVEFINSDKAKSEKKVKKSFHKPKTKILKITTQPGQVKLLTFTPPKGTKKNFFVCPDKAQGSKETKHYFYTKNKKAKMFFPESYFAKLKDYECHLKEDDHTYITLKVNVRSYPYKSERLRVNKKKVFLSEEAKKRTARERKMLKEVYSKLIPNPLFSRPFKVPLKSKITSYYGNKRIFNDKKQTQHLGNDLRAAVGVPIPASNNGKVIFTGNLFYAGNSVIIDHGLNIITHYAHLSKIQVNVGDYVPQGTIVGRAGATGRVSGPHLHWGVKIFGHNIDGFSLVKESKNF
jgi:murein DD-endopeptidase MepM/ murein hydrolase activator NlpD